jgi:CubicO group peptidase (beta-lactamase class C family)
MHTRVADRLAYAFVAALALLSSAAAQTSVAPYFPDRADWQRRTPQQAGFDAAALNEAVRFAVASESQAPKDQALAQARSFGASEPHSALIGPTKARAGLNGLIVHRGYVVAEWGDTRSVDMTHSVTKTFLTTLVGLAWQKGLIRDVGDKVRDYMPPGVDLFDAPHNQPITWDHLLRQTSDWQGTLWGKPDWADRPEGKPDEWPNRKLYAPGTRYKYNDVRMNVLALAALQVIRRPLPEVLREEVMDPIGASSTWRWYGYENSWIELDGRKVQSITGGGHWGGGMFIDAWDMARFGYLFLRNGRWQDRQIVAEKWLQMARTPGSANAEYGYANWFLNTGRKPLPAAPESSVTFRGAGQNIVYIDWQNDLIVVVRWIDSGPALNEFIARVLASMKPGPSAKAG